MVFTHDTECALVSAVELANSVEAPESMLTPEELAAFFVKHGYTGTLVGDQAELDEVRALRPELRTLLTSSRDDAVPIVNRILAEAYSADQEFFAFIRSMDAYRKAMQGTNTTMMVEPNSEFFNYLHSPRARRPDPDAPGALPTPPSASEATGADAGG